MNTTLTTPILADTTDAYTGTGSATIARSFIDNKGVLVQSHFTDLEARAACIPVAVKNSFVRELIRARFQTLSEKQIKWLHIYAVRNLPADEPAEPKNLTGEFMPIVEFIQRGFNARLKRPRVKLQFLRDVIVLKRSRDGGVFVNSGTYGTLYGKIQANGIWRAGSVPAASDELMTLLREIKSDPIATVAKHGKAMGECCFCSRELTDDRSVKQGYGKICAGNYGLPWGE